jgi:type II secretory pathway pseudopilin PulG
MENLFASKHLNSRVGFTLAELLIVAALIPILIITASRVFLSQVNSERSLIGAQSSENLRSRLSFLLESDIADGEKVLTSTGDADCPAQAGAVFIVKSPFLNNAEQLSYACIGYAISANALTRTGPPILQNGSIDYDATPLTQTVASDLQITNPTINTPLNNKVSFNITLPSFIGSPARSYELVYGTKNFRVGT